MERQAVVLLLLAVATAACGHRCEMASDDNLRALVGHVAGDQACVRRPPSFPGLAQVGPLISDRGCDYKHTVYQCRVDDKETRAKVMEAAGWHKSDGARRVKLAWTWLREATLDGTIVDEPTPDFAAAGRTFTQPSAEPTPEGGFRLRYWLVRGRGMLPGKHYTKGEAVFGADGVLKATREMEPFETS
jgi:hypothetical protein